MRDLRPFQRLKLETFWLRVDRRAMAVRLTALGCAVALALVAAAPAHADDFCAGTTGCGAGNAYSGDAAGLQAALSAAQSHPGADTVRIAAGRYDSPTGFS